MTYSDYHWKFFNFLVRRVMAIGFVVGGSILAIDGFSYILPGGTVLFNGIPSDDLVYRWTSFLLPLILVFFGIALYKMEPYTPKKNKK